MDLQIQRKAGTDLNYVFADGPTMGLRSSVSDLESEWPSSLCSASADPLNNSDYPQGSQITE